MASNVQVLFRIDVGFSPDRGYAATIVDAQLGRMKGIKGNSPEQLISRVRNVFLEEMHKKRSFPLESEGASHNRIITPEDNDPLFKGV